MAHFNIDNSAGTGAYIPYADATINDIVKSYGVDALLYNDGSYAEFDMAGTPIDTTAFYEWWGGDTFNFTDFGFLVGNTLIGAISDANLVVDYAKGESFETKVVNAGNDIFEGNDYGDVIHGGSGNDVVGGYGGDDVLFGDAGNDMLVGGAGVDAIDGGAGTDTAVFGGGTGQYILQWLTDRSGVYVTDLSGAEGTDYVHSSTEYVAFADDNGIDTVNSGWFGANFNGSTGVDVVADLNASSVLGGNNVINGNAGDDILQGGAGKDTLKGGAGTDFLEGDTGSDVLYGGAGVDAFIFDASPKSGRDAIKDFSVRDDYICLENAYFKVGSSLSSSEFRVNTTGKAQDSNDKVIYDKDSGVLYYDADGTGSKAGVAFATISKGLKLTYHDFDVI